MIYGLDSITILYAIIAICYATLISLYSYLISKSEKESDKIAYGIVIGVYSLMMLVYICITVFHYKHHNHVETFISTFKEKIGKVNELINKLELLKVDIQHI